MNISEWITLGVVSIIVIAFSFLNIKRRSKNNPANSEEILLKGIRVNWIELIVWLFVVIVSHLFISSQDEIFLINWIGYIGSIGLVLILILDLVFQITVKEDRLILHEDSIEKIGRNVGKINLRKINSISLNGLNGKIIIRGGGLISLRKSRLEHAELYRIFEALRLGNDFTKIQVSDNLLKEFPVLKNSKEK